MAKKRRQKIEKKEDYVFKQPELDRGEFVRNEIRNAKATFIAFFFAVLMSLVTYGLLRAMNDFRVGAVIGIFAIFGLPFVYNSFKLDMKDFEKKSWLGVGAVYFFTWLMISIVICNPPITDLADPEIQNIRCEVDINTNATSAPEWHTVERGDMGHFLIPKNQTFRIVAVIWDNGELKSGSIKCELFLNDQFVDSVEKVKLKDDKKYSFEYNFTGSGVQIGSEYELRITAEDKKGNPGEEIVDIKIVSALRIID